MATWMFKEHKEKHIFHMNISLIISYSLKLLMLQVGSLNAKQVVMKGSKEIMKSYCYKFKKWMVQLG